MKFDLTGYNVDNLLKTLYIKKINLFNVEKKGRNKVSFEILDKDYKKVKRHIINFKVKQTLPKIRKFPRFILANVGMILGLFLGSILGIFLSNHIWQINVYGTENLTVKEILLVLKENGIQKGKLNINTCEEIEEILLNRYDRIAQVSVIKKGTAIIINLSEKLVYTETEYQPISAKYSGIIKVVNVIAGTTNVKVGDYVNTGDILVLPFNVNADGEKVSVQPIAEIFAEIYVCETLEIKKYDYEMIKTGKKIKHFKYKFKNKVLFSGKSKNSFALFEVNVYNENISDLLPLNRDVYVYHELEKHKVERDFNQERQKLIEKSKEKAYQNLPAGDILSESTTVDVLGDVMYAITTVKVFGQIN